MSCDHTFVERHLFDYLDSTLDPSIARAFEQAIDDCDQCHELYQGAVTMQQQANSWQQQTPPDWHRTRFAVQSRKPSRFNWLNALSLSSSALALMLVLFRVEVISNTNGFAISFGGKGTQAEIAQMVDQKISELAEQQVSYIDTRFEEQQLQRVSDNQAMVETLLAHNRSERRQDMNILMASWLKQRDIDQQKLNQRVDYVVDNQIENNQYLNQVLKVSN